MLHPCFVGSVTKYYCVLFLLLFVPCPWVELDLPIKHAQLLSCLRSSSPISASRSLSRRITSTFVCLSLSLRLCLCLFLFWYKRLSSQDHFLPLSTHSTANLSKSTKLNTKFHIIFVMKHIIYIYHGLVCPPPHPHPSNIDIQVPCQIFYTELPSQRI